MAAIPKELVKEEEYKIWKKNAPFLYDTVGSYELEWPSLTVSWFPEKVVETTRKYSLHRLLIGTHTSGGEPNRVVIGQIKLPIGGLQLEENEYGGFGQGGSVGKFDIVQQINHPGEVNRARHMPQNPDIIATKTNSARVLVFDRTNHPSNPSSDGNSKPDMTLSGHTEEGYGISWNAAREGRLLSSSDDGSICCWNIDCQKTSTLGPLRTFREHEGVVEDVAWHLKSENYFASASDDRSVKLWDSRADKSTVTITGHRSEVNSVAFSPHHEFFLLSGSRDKGVGLWDVRNPSVRLHMLEGHEGSVYRVEWAPYDSSIVGSCGADGRVIVWDLRRIGCEQSPEDAADGPPELVFVHGGHTDRVSDFGWNGNESWTGASVAENNVLQVWTVAEAVHSEKVEVDEGDLE